MALHSGQLLHDSEINTIITKMIQFYRAYCSKRERGKVALTVSYYKLDMKVRYGQG